MKRLLQLLFAGSIYCATGSVAQQITPVIEVPNPPNTAAQQAKHYVILVSLDGFRYDYPTKYGAPHLQAMAKDGASAPDGMLPSYPSLTFPNHLTLVTGLYPEHHGIVANSFFDPSRTPEQGQTYVYTQPKTYGDGSWYGGTPLWVLAEQQGMRSACLFWPGSEAEIQGKRPSYYLKYDDKLDDAKRVEQVLAWLRLPPEQRPHFITLYYSNVDHAGHAYGPDSEEVRAAVHHVDDMIGDLQAGIAALKLPVDLVVVADHGMVTLKGDPIDLSTFADLSDVHTEGSLIYAKDEAQAAKIYEQFKAHPDPRFSVYRRADVPKQLHFDSNAREGDPVVVPNGPYILIGKPLAAGAHFTLRGSHGFDPATMPEMKAIFFADGPDVKAGVKLSSFENVDVYPLIAQLLDLRAPIGDGNTKVLSKARTGGSPHIIRQVNIEKTPDTTLKPEPVSADTALKVGPGITPPKPIHMVPAEYTDEARRSRLSGTVGLSIRIEKDGRVSRIAIIKGLQRGLDLNAVRAMSQSTFQPALKDGQPVVVEIDAEVNFKTF